MGKKPIVPVTYENWGISIKKSSLTHLKYVLSLSCPQADLWPFYGLQCKRFSLYKSACGPHRRDVTHILSKVSGFFYWNPFIFVGYRNDRFFSHANPYISAVSNVTQQCRCSYFEIGLPVVLPKHFLQAIAFIWIRDTICLPTTRKVVIE